MDNMLFWKILKSLFDSDSADIKKKIDLMLSWEKGVIYNDNWIKMLKYCSATFETTGRTPTQQVFVSKFPETDWFFSNAECVSDSASISQLIRLFEESCHNLIASKKVQEFANSVAINGMTFEGLNDLKKYAKQSNVAVKELSREEEYDMRIMNRSNMKTGISEIDELVSIPKGAVVTVAGFTGSFKCVAANTRINTNRGLMTIESIVNDPDPKSIRVLSEIGYKNIYQVHSDGFKPSIKVYIGGRLVETSPVHKFRVLRHGKPSWICAKDLALTDKVLIKREWIKKDYNEYKNISFYQYKKIMMEKFNNEISTDLLDRKWSVLPFSKDFYKDRFKTSVKESYELGCQTDVNSKRSFIPNYIFTATPDAQVAFIHGLLQTSGTTSSNGKRIGLTSSNYELLNELATLLLSLETLVVIMTIGDNKWRLTTENLYAKYDLIRATMFRNPESGSIMVLDPEPEMSKEIDSIESKVGIYKQNRVHAREEMAFHLNIQKVTRIEVNKSGVNLYDLSVSEHPSYIANGCVTHNTTTTANIVYRNVYEYGYNFAYISLEITRLELLLGFWCLHSLHEKFDKSKRLNTRDVRNGTLTEEQKRYLFDVIVPDFENNSKGKLKIIDEGDFHNFSEGEIIQKLEEIDDEFGRKLDGVVLDHANLCKFYEKSSDNVGEATNRFVSLFRRLSNAFRLDPETGNMRGLTTILLAQTNRMGWHEAAKKGGAYDLSALAEANELERCSSVVMTVFHDKNSSKINELKVCLLKNRYGAAHEEPIITSVIPEHYYVGDSLDGYEYNNNDVDFDDNTEAMNQMSNEFYKEDDVYEIPY